MFWPVFRQCHYEHNATLSTCQYVIFTNMNAIHSTRFEFVSFCTAKNGLIMKSKLPILKIIISL